jgi:predicted nucleotidyltransferase
MGKGASALRSQREALEAALRVAASIKRICEEKGYRLAGVYLVGSRARGDYTVESDVDIVAVVEGVESLNPLERLEAFKDALEPRVDLIVYSLEEWEREESAWLRSLKREAVRLL